MKRALRGKAALITGGASPIGQATAVALAEAGARVVLHYRSSKAEAERVATRPMKSVLFAMQLDQGLQGVRFMRRSELKLPRGFSKPRFVMLGGCVALAVATRQ